MNPKHWTYKQRNVALLIGTVVLLGVGYWAAFGKTWRLWKENQSLQTQIALTTNIDAQLLQLEKQAYQLKDLYETTNTVSHHQEILKQVSDICQKHQLLVREFPPATFHEETQYLIETNSVTVEGAFKDILKLVYELEQVRKAGRIASVTFEAGPDRKTRVYRLAAHIIIQNIKPTGNEI